MSFDMLRKMGVVLKRAQYFITCRGKLFNPFPIEERFIVNRLADTEMRDMYNITDRTVCHQMSLFDDWLKQGVTT